MCHVTRSFPCAPLALLLTLAAGPQAGPITDCNSNGVPDDVETQVTFADHAVPEAGARDMQAADIDGDLDTDVVVPVRWCENLGDGPFAPCQASLSLGGLATSRVFPADLDEDGDLDLLASRVDDWVVWFENLDGAGSFGTANFIFPNADARSIFAADLDGDGDNDAVWASDFQGDPFDYIEWGENIGGGSFLSGNHIIDTTWAVKILPADLDGDGDVDVLCSCGGGPGNLVWYENTDGLGTFGPGQHIASGLGDMHAADVDGDGDVDIMVISSAGVAWLENVDGLGTFGPANLISNFAPDGVFAADLDGDGDVDALIAKIGSPKGLDTVAWFENRLGLGEWGPLQLISQAAGRDAIIVRSEDVDGDGDRDVLATGIVATAWSENLSNDCNGNRLPDSCDVAAGTSNDCDSNGVPDECHPGCNGGPPNPCDPDCDSNGMTDSCDLRAGVSQDCNGNLVPDQCDIAGGASADCSSDGVPDDCEPDCNGNMTADSCDVSCPTPGACDLDGDQCLDDLDAAPLDPTVCADVDADGCDDCTSGTFDPGDDGTDFDGDGICLAGDCLDDDVLVWRLPSALDSLVLEQGGVTTILSWQPPGDPGGQAVDYDTLRSRDPADFRTAAVCLETDDTDTTSTDAAPLGPGRLLHYLVRVDNACPGEGSMSTDWQGIPRSGRVCP